MLDILISYFLFHNFNTGGGGNLNGYSKRTKQFKLSQTFIITLLNLWNVTRQRFRQIWLYQFFNQYYRL